MAATDLERLVVSLDADIRKFEKELKRANGIADGQFRQIERRGTQMVRNLDSATSGSFGTGLVSSLKAIGLAISVERVKSYADAWTEAGNRLKSASQISGLQARSLDDLNKIADKTRSSLSTTAELYARLLTSTAGVAKSELEVAQATEIVNKSFKAGGAAASEQAGGILQLSQALGSGLLQGDELRSIRENAPLLAQAIAKEFGTTVAGLKKLGAEGELTSERVFKAILKAGPQIEKAFGATTATITDGFTLLDNALTKAVGHFSEVSGAGAAASERLGQLARIINNLSAAIEAVSGSPAGKFLGFLNDVVSKLEPLTRALEVLSDDKLGEFLQGAFGGGDVKAQIEGTTQQIAALFEEYRKGLAVISPESLKPFDELAAKIEAGTVNADEAKEAIAAIAANDKRLGNLVDAFNPLLDKLAEVTASAKGAAAAVMSLVGDDERQSILKDRRSDQTFGKFFSDRIADSGRSDEKQKLDTRVDKIIKDAKEAGLKITEAFALGQATRELGIEKGVKEAEDALKDANKLREHQQKLISDTIASLQEETAAIGVETQHIGDSNAVRERARVVVETLNRLQHEGITITEELRAAVEKEADARFQQVATYDAAEVAADKLAQAQQDLLDQQAEVNDAFRDSMKGFISDLAHGKSLTDALTSAMSKLGDKLLDMALDNLFGKSGDSGFGLLGELFGVKSSSTTGGSGLFGNLFSGSAKSTSDISSFKTNSTLASVLGATGASSASNVSQEVTGAVSKGVSSGLKTAGDVPGTIWSFFKGKGLADHQVAGILGNVSAESGFNPKAVGDSGNAFGLFQHNDRSASLFSSIGGKGNLGDTTKQLEFAWKELQTTEVKALDALKASTDVRGATAAFAGFERPRGFSLANPEGADNFTGRLSGAEEALAKFGGTTGQATSSVSNLGQGSATALGSLSNSVGNATNSLSQFGSSLSSFLSSSMGGGSSWFQNLSGLFGGSGGAFNFMNSISPAATSSIIGAGGGFTGLFADGGYTGDMGTATPAGIVHGGEFVVNANATARNRALLEALNNGMPGYAAGGFVMPRMRKLTGAGGGGSARGQTNVNITVNTPDAPSFMRSQNQIAAKTAATVDRTFRTQ